MARTFTVEVEEAEVEAFIDAQHIALQRLGNMAAAAWNAYIDPTTQLPALRSAFDKLSLSLADLVDQAPE